YRLKKLNLIELRIFSNKLFEVINNDTVVGGKNRSWKKWRCTTTSVRSGVGLTVRTGAVVES
ncbi:hypothetical protein L195_g063626, partial [Trifolium pratense]